MFIPFWSGITNIPWCFLFIHASLELLLGWQRGDLLKGARLKLILSDPRSQVIWLVFSWKANFTPQKYNYTNTFLIYFNSGCWTARPLTNQFFCSRGASVFECLLMVSDVTTPARNSDLYILWYLVLLFDEPKSKKQYIDMHMKDVLQFYKEKHTLHMIPGEGKVTQW